MLNDIIGVFKGFFSRNFWFGNFLPVAMFSFLHLCIAWLVIPGISLTTWAQTDPKALTYFPMTFAALVVLAYALTPIIPLVRGLLDGSLLPERIHEALRREHFVSARAIRRRINNAVDRFKEMGYWLQVLPPRIWEARKKGNAGRTVKDRPAIDRVAATITSLQNRFDAGDALEVNELRAAAGSMIAALEINATELPEGHADQASAERLDRLQVQLVELLKDSETDAENRLAALQTLYSRTAYDNPQATRMADTRFLVEKYPADAYSVDFDYIWPRLQLAIPTKGDQADIGSFAEKLGSARAQIDFAVLSLALSVTIPLAWLPYLAWAGTDPVLFLVIGGTAPLFIIFFYHVAVESQIAFGDVMKAAIDNYRLDLLGVNLRQPLPATLSDERELWTRLQAIDEVPAYDLTYHYPKPQS